MDKKATLAALFLVILGFFTYFYNYQNPPKQFWDENYHIASAQKYIDRVMFMEPHPPLGKMLIALGEVLLHPNEQIDKKGFDSTDYIKRFPKGMSFAGYRFFPTLFAWLNVVLFFLILKELTGHMLLSFFGSFLYLFDNALIVHSRAAMLESIQLFFVFLAILWFVRQYEAPKKIWEYLLLGIFTGFALAVKANSAILFLLFVLWVFKDIRSFGLSWKKIWQTLAYGAGAAAIFLGVFYLHFAFGQKVVEHRYYAASKEYKQILAKKESADLKHFWIMLRDNLKYMSDYQKGVPKLNLCKPGENGSLFIGWPLGIKAINYRWEKHGSEVRYIYLQGNPVTWMIGFLAVLLSGVLVLSVWLFELPVKNRRTFEFITSFFFIYISYMIAVGQIPRVMYLYHYFIPLTISYILAVLLLFYLYEEEIKKGDKLVWTSVVLIATAIVFAWWFFSPFTYYKPLNTEQFNERVWFDFWQLKAIR
ncbi:dolichyl-phosphate-mannose-protein mannosyltransferase (plasmid) [Nitratiruptor sp. YY08-26]|uniref:phospholipid carrier-dependent glycosyltransferase n=1 Tax=unclassified Nitratiruptor TaxID=2624044 RepID=UPI0018EAE609|nr:MULTISPECIES: phospholipid carrier-dependent glycosyltransferase [unclassified Nitratiruptor]BCD63180.1 dolichyl-phosphate-mannose-protein mannosyltransferase [Nitratiruptor sp. YY08-13]BCD67116.1 dolichyl-phosphate-mannose-protein mannosyltransferase [Nitratiruptor sp. YY08-26]